MSESQQTLYGNTNDPHFLCIRALFHEKKVTIIFYLLS